MQTPSRRLSLQARRTAAMERPSLRGETAANIDLGAPLAIVGTLIGVVIVLAILAKMILPVFSNVADVNDALNDANVTTGDTGADSIKSVFPLVIGLAVVLGVVGIILGALSLKKSA